MTDSTTMQALSSDLRPRLRPGVRLVHDKARDGWVLLAPERIFEANATTVEILQRCTGTATLESIADDLAAKFTAPRERIAADVIALLTSLAEKRLVAW